MAGISTHVIPREVGWVVKRSARDRGAVFRTKAEAVKAAERLAKRGKAGQVVVHHRNGSFTTRGLRGLPRISNTPVKNSVGTEAIKRAVSAVVRARFGEPVPPANGSRGPSAP